MQVAPLPGKRVATALVLVDEAAGVLAEDRALGEEDQHPGDHRGGASGAGSPHSQHENPSILFFPLVLPQTWKPFDKDSWSSDTFESPSTQGCLIVTSPD